MRRIVVGVGLAFLMSSVASAGDPKGPWDGFGAGSWVHMKSTTKMEMPGMPSMPDNVSEMKQVLTKVTDDAWTVKYEVKQGESWTTSTEMNIPRKATGPVGGPAAKVEDLGTESVSVDGKDYSCKKTRAVAGDATVVVWTHADLGALKSESSSPTGGSSTMQVTSLSKKAKVGDKEVECHETKVTTKGSVESTMVSLTSDAVPGHQVRMETTSNTAGMKTSMVTEVVAIEVKEPRG